MRKLACIQFLVYEWAMVLTFVLMYDLCMFMSTITMRPYRVVYIIEYCWHILYILLCDYMTVTHPPPHPRSSLFSQQQDMPLRRGLLIFASTVWRVYDL
jgi:hypothetical protein